MHRARRSVTKFRCGIHRDGRHFIYDRFGRPVIHYWSINFGRLGNSRKYYAEFLNGQTVACVHRGLTRTLLHFLNTGQFRNPLDINDLYDKDTTIIRLNQLRNKVNNDRKTI